MAVVISVAALVPRPFGRPGSIPLGFDKLCHVVAHAVHVCSLLQAFDEETVLRTVPLAVGLSVGYAYLLERLQEHVPGRQFESGDVAASVVGAVFGILLARRLNRSSEEPIPVEKPPQ